MLRVVQRATVNLERTVTSLSSKRSFTNVICKKRILSNKRNILVNKRYCSNNDGGDDLMFAALTGAVVSGI